MSAHMTLRTAVVGGGTVSGVHLSGLRQNPRTELVAICDVDEERADEIASTYGIDSFYDLETMLDEIALDWVHICTPVQTHLDLALIAIEAGIPVMIEKPITETYAEVEELEAAAERHGVRVSVKHNHNFGPAMRKATALMDAGALGTVKGVDLVYTGSSNADDPQRGPWNFDLAGGEFEEGLPHPLYLTLKAGGYPRDETAIRATTNLFGSYEYDFTYDAAQVQYVSQSGILCSTKMLGGTIPNRVLLIHGDRRSLTVDLVSQTVVHHDKNYKASGFTRAQNNVDRILGRVAGTVENVSAVGRRRFNGGWETERLLNGHYYQNDAESKALLDGSPMPVPLAEGKWTIRLLEEIRNAAREGGASPLRVAPDSSAGGK